MAADMWPLNWILLCSLPFLAGIQGEWAHICVGTSGNVACPAGTVVDVFAIYLSYLDGNCAQTKFPTVPVNELTTCFNRDREESFRINAISESCSVKNVCNITDVLNPSTILCPQDNHNPVNNIYSYNYRCKTIQWAHVCTSTTRDITCQIGYVEVDFIFVAYRSAGCDRNAPVTGSLSDVSDCYDRSSTEQTIKNQINKTCNKTKTCRLSAFPGNTLAGCRADLSNPTNNIQSFRYSCITGDDLVQPLFTIEANVQIGERTMFTLPGNTQPAPTPNAGQRTTGNTQPAPTPNAGQRTTGNTQPAPTPNAGQRTTGNNGQQGVTVSETNCQNTSVGAIVGAAVGGLFAGAILGAIGVMIFFKYRKGDSVKSKDGVIPPPIVSVSAIPAEKPNPDYYNMNSSTATSNGQARERAHSKLEAVNSNDGNYEHADSTQDDGREYGTLQREYSVDKPDSYQYIELED